MRYLIFAFVLFASCNYQESSLHSISALEKQEILKPVLLLFDGMRAADSSMVKSAFYNGDVILSSAFFNKEGNPAYRTGTKASVYISAVGMPRDEVWDEQIYDLKILRDQNMAMVWAPFKFIRGTEFSHCGVNLFTLFFDGTEWKIVAVTDTRREEGCVGD